MKPALISNELSRYNRARPGLVAACAKPLGLEIDTLDAGALAAPTTLDAMLMKRADAGCDTLIINGGDGTLDFIIGRLRGAALAAWNPRIVLLKGGTTNMTHRDVGFGRDPAVALAAAMRRTTAWTETVRDVMRLHGGALISPQYGFFFGTHALTRAIAHARRTLHTRGMHGALGEALLFASSLVALLRGKAAGHPILDPGLLHYTRGGNTHTANHIFFIATTLQRLVLGMRAARPMPGQLGCIAMVAPTDGLWRQVPSLWHGAPETTQGCILRWCDQRTTLTLSGDVTLDGELFQAHDDAPFTLAIDRPVTFLS